MSTGVRWCIIVVILAVLVSGQQQKKRAIKSSNRLQLADDVITKDRISRQSSKHKPTPRPLGFFGTIKQLLFDQINDTRSGYSQISDLLSGQFSDDPQPSTTKGPITDNSTSTTAAPPKISRAEFLRILDRNIKGLRRLYNLELKEAMSDSKKNIREYQREFQRKLYEQFKD